jgi:hypothetical protein
MPKMLLIASIFLVVFTRHAAAQYPDPFAHGAPGRNAAIRQAHERNVMNLAKERELTVSERIKRDVVLLIVVAIAIIAGVALVKKVSAGRNPTGVNEDGAEKS